MATWMKTGLAGTLALAMASAAPANARDRDDGDGIGAGEIIAGAVVIGGLAALAASASDRRDYRYDRAGFHDFRPRRGGARAAIARCVNAAEREGLRFGRFANVTDIRDIDRTRFGYVVRGRILVEGGRGARWGGGWDDRGRFRCRVEAGRIVDLRLSRLGNFR